MGTSTLEEVYRSCVTSNAYSHAEDHFGFVGKFSKIEMASMNASMNPFMKRSNVMVSFCIYYFPLAMTVDNINADMYKFTGRKKM